MAGTDETKETPPPTTPTPPVAAQPGTTAAPPPVVAAEPKGGEGKDVTLPTDAIKKIKEDARDKGRREALTELDAAAVAAGFANHAEAVKYLGDLKKAPAPAATTTPPKPPENTTMAKQPKQPDPKADKAAKDAAKHAEERQRLHKDWKASKRKERELKRQLDAQVAEKDLAIEMMRYGVQDIDYGMRLLTRELAGKSEEEISKFDRKAYFEKLRGEKPYLFNEKVVPATTGTNGTKPDGSSPATPGAAAPVIAAAAATQVDATKMTKAEYDAHLKKLGLTVPS